MVWIYYAVLIVVVIGTMVILNIYMEEKMPFLGIIFVYISWVNAFLIVLLLPVDIIYEDFEDRVFYYTWQTLYWTSFILAWAVLPILTYFYNSYALTIQGKLWDLFIDILIDIAIYVPFIILFILLINLTSFSAQINSYCITLSNTVGLLRIMFFIGNGLVLIPKKLLTYINAKLMKKSAICQFNNWYTAFNNYLQQYTNLHKEIFSWNLPKDENDPRYIFIKKLRSDFPKSLRDPKKFTNSNSNASEIHYNHLVKKNKDFAIVKHEYETHLDLYIDSIINSLKIIQIQEFIYEEKEGNRNVKKEEIKKEFNLSSNRKTKFGSSLSLFNQ